MKKLLIAGVALASLIGTPTFAADMALKAPPPVVAAYDWSGIYLGLEAGGIWGNSRWNTTCLTVAVGVCPDPPFFVDNSSPHTFNTASFRGGVYVGVQKQIGSAVFGIESDVAYSNNTQSTAGLVGCTTFCGFVLPGAGNIDSTKVRLDGDGSIRGRLGFLATPDLLVYATGGFALQGVEATMTCSAAGPWCTAPRTQTDGTWLPGYTVGGGLEWRYTGSWFVRAEYRYSAFRSVNNVFYANTVDEVNTTLRVNTSMAMLGLHFKTP